MAVSRVEVWLNYLEMRQWMKLVRLEMKVISCKMGSTRKLR